MQPIAFHRPVTDCMVTSLSPACEALNFYCNYGNLVFILNLLTRINFMWQCLTNLTYHKKLTNVAIAHKLQTLLNYRLTTGL